MPEGIEVKILTECLDTLIVGKEINSVSFVSGRYVTHGVPDGFKAFEKALPLKILSVGCKGKFIYFTLEGGWYIFNTLGLTGSWEFKSDAHTRVIIKVDNSNIYFSDMRNFGTFKFVNDFKILQKKIDTLGLDIFNPVEFNELNFIKKLDKFPKKTLPEVLMDQKLFSGIGNYIKSECLYRAKLNPHRIVNSLTIAEKKELFDKIKYVVYTAYFGGNFYAVADLTGIKIEKSKEKQCKKRSLTPKFLGIKKPTKDYEFQVYQMNKDPLGNPITSETTKDKRTTHWVPAIQK